LCAGVRHNGASARDGKAGCFKASRGDRAHPRGRTCAAAVLSGGERAGLPNEAVALADAILSLFRSTGRLQSLNLAPAVALLAHGYAEADAADRRQGL